MSSTPPFVDPESNELNIAQIVTEAVPILGLVVLFGLLAALSFLLGTLFGSPLGLGFLIVTQLILAVGTGIVLLYVIARGIQLAEVDEGASESPAEN
jgi:hypothetical protein